MKTISEKKNIKTLLDFGFNTPISLTELYMWSENEWNGRISGEQKRLIITPPQYYISWCEKKDHWKWEIKLAGAQCMLLAPCFGFKKSLYIYIYIYMSSSTKHNWEPKRRDRAAAIRGRGSGRTALKIKYYTCILDSPTGKQTVTNPPAAHDIIYMTSKNAILLDHMETIMSSW
jgi:hypothetical protein